MAGTSAAAERGTDEVYEEPRVIRINRRGRGRFFTPRWDRADTARRGPLGIRSRGYCYPNHIVHQMEQDRDIFYYEYERIAEYQAEAARWRRNYEALAEERNHYSNELLRLERESDELTLRVQQLEQRLEASRERHRRDIGRCQRYRTRVRDHLREAIHTDVSSTEDEEDSDPEEEEPSEEDGSGSGERGGSGAPAPATEATAPAEIVFRDIEVDPRE